MEYQVKIGTICFTHHGKVIDSKGKVTGPITPEEIRAEIEKGVPVVTLEAKNMDEKEVKNLEEKNNDELEVKNLEEKNNDELEAKNMDTTRD